MSTIFLCPLEVYDSTGGFPAKRQPWEGDILDYRRQTEEEEKLNDRRAKGERLSLEEQARLNELLWERMPQDYHSVQARRMAKKARQGFLIDTILPEGTVHLIGGSSGIGKSTWLLQTIHDWERGIPIIGFPSHPMPYVYFMCDRSEVDLQASLEQIGLKDWDIRGYAIESLGRAPFFVEPGNLKIENLPKIFPWAKVFFIEAIHWFYQNKSSHGGQDYVDTLRFWSHVRDKFCEEDLTIIGTVHVPKLKINEGYARTRDKIFGSVAGPATAGTIIVMEGDPKVTGKVEMSICPRNSKEFKVEYQRRTTNGSLDFIKIMGEEEVTTDDPGAFSLLDRKLSRIPAETKVTKETFKNWARDLGISIKTVERWGSTKIQEHRLVKIQKGEWWVKETIIQ